MTSDSHNTSVPPSQDIVKPAPKNDNRIAAVIVTYHPDSDTVARQMAALPVDALIVVVDNASTPAELAEIKRLLGTRQSAQLIRNHENVGLAAAINQGVSHIASSQPSPTYLLLLDQDSEPQPESIGRLLEAFQALEQAGIRVGCVGPRLMDEATGLQHGFHRIRGWRWTREYPKREEFEPIECDNLNGSGTLMRTELFQHLGGLDASFFIDHVDTEWAFRVLANGYHLFGIPSASFKHVMGEGTLRFWWFGWRLWPQRSPLRHYFLFRNAVILIRKNYVPLIWKVWATIKLITTAIVFGIIDSQRTRHLSNMLAAVRDGIRGRV